ncbi:MAG: pilus assembly protein [Chloroflexi bacterium]|nr:pilus assembly protein [Chloroflexota bacterium]
MKRKERGQNIVEFALTFPVLLAVIVGLFEFGRVVWVLSSVYTASREASRYALTFGTTGGGTPHYLDCAGIREVAKSFGGPGQVADADVTISYDGGPGTPSIGTCPVNPNDLASGDRIVVQVVGHFTPAAFVPLLDIPTFDITSVNRRTLLQEVIVE